MKKLITYSTKLSAIVICWGFLSSWTGGPAVESAKDSLAIIRIIQPVNKMFESKPAVFISTGLGKIEQVKVSDIDYGNGDVFLQEALTGFLSKGYKLQTTTETAQSGMQLNTYYLKKKVI